MPSVWQSSLSTRTMDRRRESGGKSGIGLGVARGAVPVVAIWQMHQPLSPGRPASNALQQYPGAASHTRRGVHRFQRA
jgi:hypothetical protein